MAAANLLNACRPMEFTNRVLWKRAALIVVSFNRISSFATKSERSLPPYPEAFNQLPTDSEEARVRYVSHRSF